MYIAIAGNMGSGKSSLTKLLSEHYGWVPCYEQPDKNPYLKDFYNDMSRWAYHSQMHFLAEKIKLMHSISRQDSTYILDRHFCENSQIFTEQHFQNGYINHSDMETYRTLTSSIYPFLESPALTIYLKSSEAKLMNNIKLRSRSYELTLDQKYVSELNIKYEEWIKTLDQDKLLTLDMDSIDFIKNTEDFRKIIKKIDLFLPHF